MIKIFPLIFALLCLFASVAQAEGGCPPGQYPQQGQGWQTCVPIPGSSSASQNASPARHWIDQWLAIATDTSKGILGTAIGKATRSEAEADAMTDCKQNGGTACIVQISEGNACVAMILGKERVKMRTGASQMQAEVNAMHDCEADDGECKIYYSACSRERLVP